MQPASKQPCPPGGDSSTQVESTNAWAIAHVHAAEADRYAAPLQPKSGAVTLGLGDGSREL
jgi:hypothetical protein